MMTLGRLTMRFLTLTAAPSALAAIIAMFSCS